MEDEAAGADKPPAFAQDVSHLRGRGFVAQDDGDDEIEAFIGEIGSACIALDKIHGEAFALGQRMGKADEGAGAIQAGDGRIGPFALVAECLFAGAAAHVQDGERPQIRCAAAGDAGKPAAHIVCARFGAGAHALGVPIQIDRAHIAERGGEVARNRLAKVAAGLAVNLGGANRGGRLEAIAQAEGAALFGIAGEAFGDGHLRVAGAFGGGVDAFPQQILAVKCHA